MNNISYGEETKTNEEIFISLTKEIRPDIYVVMEALDKTEINPYILLSIIRELTNINMGTGWGQVRIDVTNRIVTRIFSEQNQKLELPLIKKRQIT